MTLDTVRTGGTPLSPCVLIRPLIFVVVVGDGGGDAVADCVIHLVTAADGAEPFYTLGKDVSACVLFGSMIFPYHLIKVLTCKECGADVENNGVRTENPETARKLDAKIKHNWVGHPHLYVAGNCFLALH